MNCAEKIGMRKEVENETGRRDVDNNRSSCIISP